MSISKCNIILRFSFLVKKLGRVGKDRPTGIDFLEEASASPTEKIPEPWPRPDTGGRSPWEPCLGHVRVLRPTWGVHTSALSPGPAWGFFYPQAEIRSHGESNSGPEGCRRSDKPTGLASLGTGERNMAYFQPDHSGKW